MAIIQTHACDVCGNHKRDANHWWKVVRVLSDGRPGMLIVEWTVTTLERVKAGWDSDIVAHLCGANCVTQWLSKHVLEVKG